MVEKLVENKREKLQDLT